MDLHKSVMSIVVASSHVRPLIVWVMLTACGLSAQQPGDSAGSTGGTEETSDEGCSSEAGTTQEVDVDAPTCQPGAPANACCCFFASHRPIDGFPTLCAKKILCPELTYSCGFDGPETSCSATVDCHLAALQRGEYGVLRWRYHCFELTDDREVYIVGDGTVFERWWFELDLGLERSAAHSVLRPPEYFAGCLTLADVSERITCMREGIVPEPLEVCY